jgi:hypothetical protein
MSVNSRKKTKFVWDETKLKAAELIAKGENRQGIAKQLSISDRTLRRWAGHPDFQQKIDEIIAEIDIAQKGERIKIAKKVIRQKLNQKNLSDKDLLDWLKYVGEEIGDYSEVTTLKIIWAGDDKKDDGKGA